MLKQVYSLLWVTMEVYLSWGPFTYFLTSKSCVLTFYKLTYYLQQESQLGIVGGEISW